MVKKTLTSVANKESSLGEIDGLINSLVISNPENHSAYFKIYTDSILIFNTTIPSKESIRIKLDIIFNEELFIKSSQSNTAVIVNIIETV